VELPSSAIYLSLLIPLSASAMRATVGADGQYNDTRPRAKVSALLLVWAR
jgi:hypothetical protein